MGLKTSITDVPGIRVGHAHDVEALTGCTVVLCGDGAVAGVDQRGGAPGTRETDLLRPLHKVQKVHAVLLSGGSAFGLDAAGGVVRYLEERGIGYDTQVAKVPIVPAAIIFDLHVGQSNVRPDAAMGYAACQATSDEPPAEGNAGAGMGAIAGQLLGPAGAMKSGIGTASTELGSGAVVGAIVVANPFGDVIDPTTGMILAGTRPAKVGPIHVGGEGPFIDTLEAMKGRIGRTALRLASRSNSVIGVVATDADLTKEEANKVAQMAHNGIARAVRPAHTMHDGDTIFALSMGRKKIDVSVVGAYAAEVVAQAIVRAVMAAEKAGGVPSVRDL
ncbi:MAG: peptidase S58 [Anaerolineae bacterium SM23_ 63]|nr:MAG: peptidase S58 [Anaerolineae bacterium SM23_ 63]